MNTKNNNIYIYNYNHNLHLQLGTTKPPVPTKRQVPSVAQRKLSICRRTVYTAEATGKIKFNINIIIWS